MSELHHHSNGNHAAPCHTPAASPAMPELIMSPSAGPEEMELLMKLEEANRALEADRKALQPAVLCMSKQSGHSRQGSQSSVMSSQSTCSNLSYLDAESPDDLWHLWGQIVNDWDAVVRKKAGYIKELVRKGIPHHFRGIVWQLLCNAHISPAKQAYAEYIKMTSPFEKVIRRDITRTYPEHDFFKVKDGLGQESLFNVMKAYSIHDREVGYCQGSGFIVGLILMQMPEEETFAVLVQLMQEYRMRDLFKPTMAELGLCMFQLECMIQEQIPELYMHFQSQNFCVSMFASSWFLTLFSTSLPLTVVCRIVDILLSEGMEIVHRVGFSILDLAQDALMARDMEGMLKYLQKSVPAIHEADPDGLLSHAFQVKYSAKKMKKLEKEYNTLKTKEHEDQVELRRLRTENRLLRQRIDNLEKETATLANRLVQDQVIRAQKEEEIFVLRRELATQSQHNAEVQSLYEATLDELRQFKEKASVVASMPTVTESEQLERIQQLSSHLSESKHRETQLDEVIRQLRDQMKELESTNRKLQDDPTSEIQSLQEELIACKLREAEANLSMKELRQRVSDLDKYWQKHLEQAGSGSREGTPSKSKQQHVAEELMTVRLREADALADSKEMKQKVMELETQHQILTRQLKRMDAENTSLKERLDDDDKYENELKAQIKEFERKSTDVESRIKEDEMMDRIKDAEHSQAIAEMRQKIAELEIENQEMLTAGQFKGDTQDLENRVADLQEEVMQLKMAKRLQSISSMALNHMTLDSESDYDTDDMDATITDMDKLRLRGSSIGGRSIDSTELTMAEINKLKLKCVDSSDGETGCGFENENGTVKRRTSKAKKKKVPTATLR